MANEPNPNPDPKPNPNPDPNPDPKPNPNPDPKPNPNPDPKPNPNPNPDPKPSDDDDKKFSQSEIDKIIAKEKERERARLEKQYGLSDEDRAAFDKWKQTQKTPEQIKAEAEAAQKAEIAEKDNKILSLERKQALTDIGIYDSDARLFIETLALKEMKDGDTNEEFLEYSKKIWEKHAERFKTENEKAAGGQRHKEPAPVEQTGREALHERLYKK